ncbi:hypothetical protein GCM10027447_14620 [Glycomyces halotolerans]
MTPRRASARSTVLGRIAAWSPVPIIAVAVAGALAINLAIWLAGAAFGGSFTYVEPDGALHTTTAPRGVIVMTVIPMALGLAVAVLLAMKWRGVVRLAQVIGAGAALATTTTTFTAGFDTVSTIALSCMHLVIAVAVVFALEAIDRRAPQPS